MACWRSYRKFRAEAVNIAERSSSEEDYINQDNIDDNASIGHQSDVEDSRDNGTQECTSSSSDSVSNEGANDTAGTSSVSPVTLRTKLAT